MDEATMIGAQMGETENIQAWSGEDLEWATPTRSFTRGVWMGRLRNFALYTIPAIAVTAAAMWVVTGMHPDRQATPPVMSYAAHKPPVPHPTETPVDPYHTQVVSQPEFFQSLKDNDIPTPPDALKEARDICRLLEGGMDFRAVALNTEMNHPDWTALQAGGFTGASAGFCPKYRP
jgi:Protein of unknown function (DUF732)